MTDNKLLENATDSKIRTYNIFYGYQFISSHFDINILEQIINSACEQAEQQLIREFGDLEIKPSALDPSAGGILISDLKSSIKEADICIFEVSDKNPNVFLETGYSMGLEKRVILLVVNEIQEEIPSDIKGLTYLPYLKINPYNVVSKLANNIIAEIRRIIKSQPLSFWFWENLSSSPANVFLGRTAEDNFSWGDVVAMDLLRTNLKNQNNLILNLKSDIHGEALRNQVISIGGPRRNKITESILNMIAKKAKYSFIDTKEKDRYKLPKNVTEEINKIQSDEKYDSFIIYDTIEEKMYYSEVNFFAAEHTKNPDEKKKLINGNDFGLVYKIANPMSKDIFWTVFTAISRAGTLSCLEAMLKPDVLRKIEEKIVDTNSDLEILFQTIIVNGRGIGAIPIDCRKLEDNKKNITNIIKNEYK